jgi:hypothetical protein
MCITELKALPRTQFPPRRSHILAGLEEIMLAYFFDAISRWFENSRPERRDDYFESAKTMDEVERRMRDIDRWLGP